MPVMNVSVEKCKSGDILAENIISRDGVVMAVQNTVLNSYIIGRISALGISKLKIFSPIPDNDAGQDNDGLSRTREDYKKAIFSLKSIVSGLAAGKPLDAGKLNEISETICCGVHESCNLIRVLDEEKEFDEYTYTHSLNVALYSMLAGKWLKLDDDGILDLVKAGILHDVGKVKVPAEILNKPARLTNEEFEVIKKHTLYGYDLAKSVDCLSKEVCETILTHHEREDRSGYPHGLSGERISVYAKIIAVADVYDAMTSDRVYKKRATPFEAFRMFKTTGVKNFDPHVANTFLLNLSTCYVGTKVLLDTGETGEIAYIPPQCITEPIISVNSNYIDLSRIENKKILSLL